MSLPISKHDIKPSMHALVEHLSGDASVINLSMVGEAKTNVARKNIVLSGGEAVVTIPKANDGVIGKIDPLTNADPLIDVNN